MELIQLNLLPPPLPASLSSLLSPSPIQPPMPLSQDTLRLSAVELRRLLEQRAISAVELTQACLDQIGRYNGTLNAVVTISEEALDTAARLDEKAARGEALGPLHGLPVGIKDVTPVANTRTTFGSLPYANHIASEDALIVSRLKKAGAVVIGKTNTPEFAAGGNTFNKVFGRTRNPWNPDRSAGGSTGGGAAGLASGMIAFAEGTDLGGSLRIPASFCGVVGLRPSAGLIPTYPSDYLWDNLQVTGPMARTVEDIALILEAVSGPSPLCPIYQPVAGRSFVDALSEGLPQGIRIAFTPDIAGIGVDPGIESICRNVALSLDHDGLTAKEIKLDLSFGRDPFLALRGYWMLAHHYHRIEQLDEFDVNLSGNIKAGLQTTPEALGNAEQVRGKMWRVFYDFFEDYDFLLTPCMAVSPFPVEQNYPDSIAGKPMKTYIDWIAPTFVLSMTGLPVASVPVGIDALGLPVGLQIVGKPMGEEAVLALAQVIQRAHPIGLPPLEKLRQR